MRISDTLMAIHQPFFHINKQTVWNTKLSNYEASRREDSIAASATCLTSFLTDIRYLIPRYLFLFTVLKFTVTREAHIGVSKVLQLFKIILFLKKGT